MKNRFDLFICLLLFVLSSNMALAQEYGVASYYSDAFHGRKTASGEMYNKNEMTAGHKKLKFGTVVKVTRLDNNSSVRVRINDRGPYISGRIIELSKKAASRLGILNDGHAKVKIEIVGKGKVEEETVTERPKELPAKIVEEEKKYLPPVEEYSEEDIILQPEEKPIPPRKEEPRPKIKIKPKEPAVKKREAVAVSQSSSSKVSLGDDDNFRLVKSKDYKPYDLYKVQLVRPKKKGFGVQVASVGTYEGVMRQVASLQDGWFENILVSIEKGKNNQTIYKVILGPFEDRKTAEAYKVRLRKKKRISGFTVDLDQIQY